MLAHPLNAIVCSERGLIRTLLGEMLINRFGVRIVGRYASLEEAVALAHAAGLLVIDLTGDFATDFPAFRERLRTEQPALRVVTIDNSLGDCGIEDIVRAVLASGPAKQTPHDALTPLESEVMLAVAAGLRNADIARRMRRSTKTVEKHRANALRKLGFRNVAQLTAYAIRHRLLDIDLILGQREL